MPSARPATRARHAGRRSAEINVPSTARGALPAFEMGIGLHTGEAVVGNIGPEQRAGNARRWWAARSTWRAGWRAPRWAGSCSPRGPCRAGIAGAGRTSGPSQVKGLSELLIVHELQGLGGRFERALPVAPPEAGRRVSVDLGAGMLGDRWQDRTRRYPHGARGAPRGAGDVRELGEAPAPLTNEAEAPVLRPRLRVAPRTSTRRCWA